MNPQVIKIIMQSILNDWLIWGGVIALALYAALTMFRINQYLKRKARK